MTCVRLIPVVSALGFAAVLLAVPTIAAANLRVTFHEGAPKDRFQIKNASDCTLDAGSILLDLSTSPAGLIFDVSGQGAGVEVFQPFEMVEGEDLLTSNPAVLDGQSEVRLEHGGLGPGQVIAFTIDVDNTVGRRAITVSGAEIEGASVTVSQGEESFFAIFSTNARADLAIEGCEAGS